MTEIKKALQAQTANGYSVKVNASVLNIRKGAGTNYAVVETIKDRGTYEIIEEATGAGAKKWGKLADGRGWIALDYCIKS
ncbi:MAG: SH3 domain-containing protein [Lachnospiraceae bacterium]|nr:SH3 domain-containing protein [Lachnospiraceae bacterium]